MVYRSNEEITISENATNREASLTNRICLCILDMQYEKKIVLNDPMIT